MKYKVTLILSLLTPLLLVIAVFLMGGGHGFYAPARVLFPSAMISFPIMNRLEWPFIILGILQFPIYGLFIDKYPDKSKTVILLFAFHFLLVIIASIKTRAMLY
jgi:hypothetical protein